jgi:hypothetical protein
LRFDGVNGVNPIVWRATSGVDHGNVVSFGTPIMAHAEIGVQDKAIDAIVAAAQQILTVLPSLYWSRKAYIWPLPLLAPR